MANHETVPGSSFTKGTADRRKSATSFSLPGFACSGTYKANFVITMSSSDTASADVASTGFMRKLAKQSGGSDMIGTQGNGNAVVDLIFSMAKREVTFFSGMAAMSCL